MTLSRCPVCRSQELRPSTIIGATEQLLALIGLAPIRCLSCDYRFLRLMRIEKRVGAGRAPARHRSRLPDLAPAPLERAWVSDRLGVVVDVQPVLEVEPLERKCEPRRFEERKSEPTRAADGWLWMVNGASLSPK